MSSFNTLIQIIGTITGLITDRSLVSVSKSARVEPLTVVSKDMIAYENTGDILQTALSIFTGYYLQAAALSATINRVEVSKILDRLNPDADGSLIDYTATEIGLNSLEHKLPGKKDFMFLKPGMEDTINFKVLNTKNADLETDPKHTGGVLMQEASNLAVGKNIVVTFNTEDAAGNSHTEKVPVTIRLATVTVPNNTIIHILSNATQDVSLVERYHAWRSGRISFIKDLVFCCDLVDERRKALMNDESGVLAEIVRRARNTKQNAILNSLSAQKSLPSLATASNIYVVSEVVAKELEQKLGGKLSNPNIRNKAFKETYAMLLVVVDREYERVKIYHRGIAAATEVSIRDIKSSNKQKGPDIMDVLKAYNMGNAPSL